MNSDEFEVPPSDQVKIAGTPLSVSDLLIEFAPPDYLAAETAPDSSDDSRSNRHRQILAHRELQSIIEIEDAVELGIAFAQDAFRTERVRLSKPRAVNLLIDQVSGKLGPDAGALVISALIHLISCELKDSLAAINEGVQPNWRTVYLALSLAQYLDLLGAHHLVYEKRGTQHATKARQEIARTRATRLRSALASGTVEPNVDSAWEWLKKQPWQKNKKISRETARLTLREAQEALGRAASKQRESAA